VTEYKKGGFISFLKDSRDYCVRDRVQNLTTLLKFTFIWY